jgi:predicted metal-dependent hydrolase
VIEHRLYQLSSVPLKLIWHENQTTYLSVFKQRGLLSLRIHRLFYNAPTPVLEALLQFAIRKDPQARIIIRQMARLHFSQHQIQPKALIQKGKTYDLQEILDRLLSLLPVSNIAIGWSKGISKGSFRSITFGTYHAHMRQIRINPLLDDPEVPLYFLEFIVYHEMLHAVCPSQMNPRGRCSIHTKEFREKERQFPQFQQAKEWEKGCLTFFKQRKSHGRT